MVRRGVIGQELNIDAIVSAMPQAAAALCAQGSDDAAHAIMTTDTRKKEVAVAFELGGKEVHLGAISKGSGMIHPNMGTTLSFLTTDCAITPRVNDFYLFGGKDESSASLIQGITFAGVLLDEVVLMPRSFVEQACARGIRFCYLGDARFNTGNSLMVVCAKLGLQFTACAPKAYWPRDQKQRRFSRCQAVGNELEIYSSLATACHAI